MQNTQTILGQSKGVIHIGANAGQERNIYASLNLNVLWIESIPDIFAKLQINIANHSKQKAIQALVTDQDNVSMPFHVANNHGTSSSIFNFALHKEIWPGVKFTNTIQLESKTLNTIFKDNNLITDDYDGMIIDTQGSELLVLKGGTNVFPKLKWIITEAADFNAYEGCCQITDLQDFLSKFNFIEQGYCCRPCI